MNNEYTFPNCHTIHKKYDVDANLQTNAKSHFVNARILNWLGLRQTLGTLSWRSWRLLYETLREGGSIN
ncbi:MAG: hypothetical protein RMY28_013890 [Nostoc sp. ChiSLP01]